MDAKIENKCIHHTGDKVTFPQKCKALADVEVRKLKKAGKCGSYACPFYKEDPREVR